MAYNPKGGKKNFLIEFTNVTNEERNHIVRFVKVGSYDTYLWY